MMKRGHNFAPLAVGIAILLPACSAEQEPILDGSIVESSSPDAAVPLDPENRALDEVIQPAAVDIARDVVGAVQKAHADLGRTCGMIEPMSEVVAGGCAEVADGRTFYGIERVVTGTETPGRTRKYIAAILLNARPDEAAPRDTAVVQLEVYDCPLLSTEEETSELGVQAVVYAQPEADPSAACFREKGAVLIDETLPNPVLNPATEQYRQTGHWAAYHANDFGLPAEATTAQEALQTVELARNLARSALGR